MDHVTSKALNLSARRSSGAVAPSRRDSAASIVSENGVAARLDKDKEDNESAETPLQIRRQRSEPTAHARGWTFFSCA